MVKLLQDRGVKMQVKNRSYLIIFLSLIFILNSAFTVVGHRGDPTKYPEETIQSDNSAFKNGADYVELDLHLSQDGVVVVSHDDDLFRMLHSHVIVSQNSFNSLERMHYDNGEHVLSLAQLFAYYKNKPQTKFILETKVDHSLVSSYELEDKIASIVKKYQMQDRIMIHSFSNYSLFRFSHTLPSVKLIQIVGSLKRINFSVLPQVWAVNISSDLIYSHPFIINWLHRLHKKVFVWAEMDESPRLWNWLINKNVDGVVTNYPALGYKYKLAKAGTKKYLVDRTGTYFGKSKIPAVTNPYIKIKQKHYIYPGQKLHVTYAVQNKDKLYYQIAKHTFIPSDFVTFDLSEKNISAYQDKKIIAKNKRVPIYSSPENFAKTGKYLNRNQLLKIENFGGSPQNLWLYTKVGWIRAKDILFYGFFSKQDFTYYQALPKLSRYPNIALLSYPIEPANKVPSFLTNQKIINKLKKD